MTELQLELEKKDANFPFIYVVGYLDEDGDFEPFHYAKDISEAEQIRDFKKKRGNFIIPERITIIQYEVSK